MKKNVKQQANRHDPIKKFLAVTLSSLMTTALCTSVQTYASDVEIYQQAKSGDITLMFMLDISGSMTSEHPTASVKKLACELSNGTRDNKITYQAQTQTRNGVTYRRQWCEYDKKIYLDRITRLKDGMIDLLLGNPEEGINRISDDKIIGISTLAANNGLRITNKNSTTYATGAILVPARRLDDTINVNNSIITQRQLLINTIVNLEAAGSTPTARSYAEVIAYLMGKSTSGTGSGFSNSDNSTKNSAKTSYIQPTSLIQSEEKAQCSGQGIYVLTDGEPSGNNPTDSLAKKALDDTFSCKNSDAGWDCVDKMRQALIDKKNPINLKLKTAVVGFGSSFNNITSFDRSKTQEQNIAALGTINWNDDTKDNVKKAAYWGIKGEGGWYSGSSSQDIIDSVNNFINDLGSDIPVVTTGTPTIPTDQLNPAALQNFAYYPQFEPTPEKTYQLWLGNLKKYNVASDGQLTGKDNQQVADLSGKIVNPYDLWSPNSLTDEQKKTIVGGVKQNLDLGHTNNEPKRKLLTNRDSTKISYPTTMTLQQVKLDYLSDSAKKNDPKVGYLMNLLGYSFDPSLDTNKPLTIDKVKAFPELRQVGAVMHSSPVLLTNEGRVDYDRNTGDVISDNRQDYILFGTTQGLLQVVDTVTGKEKFAFVPNELIESQYLAFNKPELSNLGIQNMYYGVDGPWTVHTEYVEHKTKDGYLTVGEGAYDQKGKQYVYGGLRMGGRSYYSLDLSNIDAPKLKFQILPSGTCSASNPIGCMGQSWSKPTITYVKWQGQKKLVMLVGGGYDAGGEDGNARPYSGYESDAYNQTNQRGAGVYMFDAENGDLLWWASANADTTKTTKDLVHTKDVNLKYSVVSQIKAVDRNADGLTDHLYFGDLGGQVWRIDLNNALSSNEFNTQPQLFSKAPVRILNLNKGAASPRFYEMPAFSTYNENGKIFGVLSIGSGNRSKPLAEYTYEEDETKRIHDFDGIFNIYDKDVASSNLYDIKNVNNIKTYDYAVTTKDVTLNTNTVASTFKLMPLTDENRFSSSAIIAPYASSSGWYYKFKSNKVQSEKVTATPIVINNDLFVTTFDGSKPGLAGDCGAGVKGESFMTLFCMPYGQCGGGSAETYRLNLGAGIVGGAVGSGDPLGLQRLIVANRTGNTNSEILGKKYSLSQRLTPQRWYEKN